MPSRKKARIGRRHKYSTHPRKKINVPAEYKSCERPDDLLSLPLDTFFLQENATYFDTIPENYNELTDSDGFHADEFIVILDKPYRYSPDVDLDEFISNQKIRIFSELRERCKHEVHIENFMYMNNSSDLKYVQLYDSDIHWATPRVKACVSVSRDLRLSISVHGKEIPDSHTIWGLVGRDCMCVERILKEVAKYDVCRGNQDTNLQDLIPVTSFLDVGEGYKYQGYKESFYIGSTIRSTRCNLLIDIKTICEQCDTYRRTLRKTLSRRQLTPKVATPNKNWMSSKVSNAKLTESQKIHKIKQLKAHSKRLESEVAKLKREIKKKIAREGVVLSESEGKDIADIMESSESEIRHSYPDENSYQRIFWEQQRKYAKLKNKHGMRWHPAIVKFCIYLKSKSSSTYDSLRNSGFVKLPSERTLFDYTSVTKKGTGFQSDIVEMLIEETQKLEGHQRVVGILQDEVKIKSDLVYDRHTGELVGFVDLGTISNDLLTLQDSASQHLAKYVLVLMVRGISTNMKYPLAHFATTGVTSDQLFCILWEAVELLEIDVNLEVLYITSDGASPNRRFIRLHQSNNALQTVFSSLNVYAPFHRDIYFISDPPHLIKTARNCFANSYSHKRTRTLWKDGYDISWLHIVDLFKDHCSGIYRLCPKLTKEHIDVTSFGAMKVRLASQVLSSTVASALEMNYDNRVAETVKFIRMMNKFFDCLNTRHLGEAARMRNQNLREYRSIDDERLTFLQNDFLSYFSSWERSVQNRPGQFTKSQRNQMLLSHQTLEGLKITVNSIVNCVRYCLNIGMEFVLTERFNQDPIEQHFGIHRSSLGSNTNPSLQEFNNSMVQIRTVGSQAIAPFRGNTHRLHDLPAIDATPMRKRKRHNST